MILRNFFIHASASLASRPKQLPWRSLQKGAGHPWLLVLLMTLCGAQTPTFAHAQKPIHAQRGANFQAAAEKSARAELFYLVLLAELQGNLGNGEAAYGLMMEAARKSPDEALFQRAFSFAARERAADAALQAATAWSEAHPKSDAPLRAKLQLLINLNRVREAGPTLTRLIESTAPGERGKLIDAVGDAFVRLDDRAAGLNALSLGLTSWLERPETRAHGLTALARMQAAAGQRQTGERLLLQALQSTPSSESAGLLAVEWSRTSKWPSSESIELFLQGNPSYARARLAQAKALMATDQFQPALAHLRAVTGNSPEMTDAWLFLGLTLAQLKESSEAKRAFDRFLEETETNPERHARGRSEAFLSLAQMAVAQEDWTNALRWLEDVSEPDAARRAVLLRAAVLVGQGKADEALMQARSAPENSLEDKKAKLMAEAHVLRLQKRWAEAHEALDAASKLAPENTDLLYDAAMMAERAGRFTEMEHALRTVLSLDPAHYSAYNALGYSLADRNERLEEAETLIRKALELAPQDPYIIDSMGWLEYRKGNFAEAENLLRRALLLKFDAEIAVHLGEVLWVRGKRSEALDLFRRAHASQPDNQTLSATLKRLDIAL